MTSSDKRLGWLDFTFRADGETHGFEVEVLGRLEARWIGEGKELVITGVYLTGADARVNILPALTPNHIKAIANEVKPQAVLRDDRPDLLGEAA